jgi:hypothetical protein
MDSTLSALFKLEVLNRVGDVDGGSIYAGLFQGLVEQATRGPDEWATLQILLVTRLLADEYNRR